MVTAATQRELVSWFIGKVNDPAVGGQTSIPLAPHGHGCNTEGTCQLVHGEVNDPAADGQTSIPLALHGHGCNTVKLTSLPTSSFLVC